MPAAVAAAAAAAPVAVATVRMLLLPVLTLLLLLPAKQLGLHCIDAIPIASRAPGPEPGP